MATHVRLDEDVYAKIKARKRGDETFSDAIDRLTSNWSLGQWGEQHEMDEALVEHHRRILEDISSADREALEAARE